MRRTLTWDALKTSEIEGELLDPRLGAFFACTAAARGEGRTGAHGQESGRNRRRLRAIRTSARLSEVPCSQTRAVAVNQSRSAAPAA